MLLRTLLVLLSRAFWIWDIIKQTQNHFFLSSILSFSGNKWPETWIEPIIQCHRARFLLLTSRTWRLGILWRSDTSGIYYILWDVTKVRSRGGHMGWLRYYTDSCHFSFPWLRFRFKLTFLATRGPCGSCKAQMSSWGNAAHILFIWQTCESGTRQVGSWVVAPHIPLSWSWVGVLGVASLFLSHAERYNVKKSKWIVCLNLEIFFYWDNGEWWETDLK